MGLQINNRILSVTLIVLALSLVTGAQAQSGESRLPEIPGTFVLETGLNLALNKPDNFKLKLFGSRTINIYYQYEWKGLSKLYRKLTLVPGIGISMERYSFSNQLTPDGFNTGQLSMSARNLSIKRSKFITNFVEIPIEIRYAANPDNPNRSFKIGAGFRVGYLINSHTKVVHVVNGKNRREKLRQDWFVNKLRYGPFLKISVGNTSLFGYYTLTPLFESGKGPEQTTLNNFSVGISINGF